MVADFLRKRKTIFFLPQHNGGMTDEELLQLDKNGWIPGPGETEEAFLARVKEGEAPSEWVCLHLEQLFGFRPTCLPIVYSNRSLAPWQAAAVWVEGRQVKKVQLRKALQKGSYLGLYNRDEILAHESVHAARGAFEESAYEEFFAYMTAPAKWRRVLGPIVERPWEVWPLLFGGMAGALWPVFYWVVTIWAGLGFARLIRRHRCLNKAAQKLGKNARAILVRLTDEEIERLAKDKPLQDQSDLRWRLLRAGYQMESVTC